MQHNFDFEEGKALPKIEITGTNYEVGGSK
jgi:hypothetical protein